MRVTIVLVLLALAAHTHAKVYGRCELAWELKCYYDIPMFQLADWVCLAHAESNYDTALTSGPSNSKDYGIFQINDFWCKFSASPTSRECRIDCSKLTNSYLGEDVGCVKQIFSRLGFEAWDGYIASCKGKDLSSYISDCNLTCY